MYRQGDVLIVPVESIPEELDPVDREDGRVVLAHGEVTATLMPSKLRVRRCSAIRA